MKGLTLREISGIEKESNISPWYVAAVLDRSRFPGCSAYECCEDCDPNGSCDQCDTVDGRWIEAVCEYASTCDYCGELTAHVQMSMNPETQQGFCDECFNKAVRVKLIKRCDHRLRGKN